MNDWQEWVVALLLLLCIIRIGMNVISFFRRTNGKRNPCENCATGCDIKRMYDEKRRTCEAAQKPKASQRKGGCCCH